MEGYQQTKFKPGAGIALFILVVLLTCILVGFALMAVWPNANGIGMILITGFCATPLAFILFLNPKIASKVKPYQHYLFSALAIPVIAGLLIGWTLFEQRPTNIFKVFVADPIPTGVTNIHARDVSGGFDQEIVGWFQATPEAIDEIISENELVLVGEDELISDPPIRYFPEIQWNENWQHYRKNFSDSPYKLLFLEIWVNSERNMAIFQFVDG